MRIKLYQRLYKQLNITHWPFIDQCHESTRFQFFQFHQYKFKTIQCHSSSWPAVSALHWMQHWMSAAALFGSNSIIKQFCLVSLQLSPLNFIPMDMQPCETKQNNINASLKDTINWPANISRSIKRSNKKEFDPIHPSFCIEELVSMMTTMLRVPVFRSTYHGCVRGSKSSGKPTKSLLHCKPG